MQKFTDLLMRLGSICAGNKYLNAIKNAFQNYIPFTVAGAVGILWTSVIVNADNGLGKLWEPIMALKFLNPAFSAVQYFCISCITVGIIVMLAIELAKANNEDIGFSIVLCLAGWVAVTDISSGGIPSGATGANGMFCGLIMTFFISSLFHKVNQIDALKIKMPEQVPTGVARAFELMVPIILISVVCGLISVLSTSVTGGYLNDIIYSLIQEPLMLVGGSFGGFIVLITIKQLFWSIGIHGGNLVGTVTDALWLPLMTQNMENFANGVAPTNIITTTFSSIFTNMSGSGVTITLIVCMLIYSKRAENRTICKISLAPALFNINETVIFGLPIVMNPIICIPFIIAPIVSATIAYVLTMIGFCPMTCVMVPWTTPPVLSGFLATGGSIYGAITQIICLIACVAIYLPFIIAYEKQQNALDQQQ